MTRLLFRWFVLSVASTLAATAGPASAATIGINGTILTATAEPGDDVLIGSVSGTNLEFLGVIFDIVTPGCMNIGPVSCVMSGLTEVRIVMGAGSDVVDLSGITPAQPFALFVLGGDGDDVLLGSPGNETMFGGAGDDILIGGTGSNCLSGGAGDNVVLDSNCSAGIEPVFEPATPVAVPAPGALALLMCGLGALAMNRRRQKWRAAVTGLSAGSR